MPHDDVDARQPFQPFHQHFVQRQGEDAAFLEKIRRSVAWWDRWRWLGVVLHAAIIGFVVWLSFQIVELIQWMNGPAPQGVMPETVVVLGVVLGAKMGFLLQQAVWGALMSLGGFRAERLAIAYHDAIEQHCRQCHGEAAAANSSAFADNPDG